MKPRYLLAIVGLLLAVLASYQRSLALSARENIRNLCITRVAARQTGGCEPASLFSGHWRLCDLLWPEPSLAATNREISLDAAQLSAGGAYLYRLDVWQPQEKILRKDWVYLGWDSVISVTLNPPPGLYELQLRGLNDRPGPVLLHLSVSGEPLAILRFHRDDDSWETKCLLLHPMHWPGGKGSGSLLTLRIDFINDGGPNGSRDAGIGWVRLVPLPSGPEPRRLGSPPAAGAMPKGRAQIRSFPSD